MKNPQVALKIHSKSNPAHSESSKSPPAQAAPNVGPARNVDSSLSRCGKIARLPAAIREALNRYLAEGVSGTKLREWLNGLPGTQAILRQYFNGQPISQQNLSEWRQGGFRDWLLKQEAKQVLSEFAAHNHDLASMELNETLALWLGSRLVTLAGRVEQQDPEESWPVVRQMIRDVASLRRGDHRIREQRFKEKAKDKITNREHREWVFQPGRLEALCQEVAQKHTGDINFGREVVFKVFGHLFESTPDDLEWEAKKRGITVEQLVAERDALYPHWRKYAPPPYGTAVPETETLPTPEETPPPAAETPKTKNQAQKRKAAEHRPEAGNGKSPQGKTQQNKPEQTKTNRDSARPPVPEAPVPKDPPPQNAPKNPPPPEPGGSAEPVTQVGSVEQSAPEPALPSYYCRCGPGADQLSTDDCIWCQDRVAKGIPVCPCHYQANLRAARAARSQH